MEENGSKGVSVAAKTWREYVCLLKESIVFIRHTGAALSYIEWNSVNKNNSDSIDFYIVHWKANYTRRDCIVKQLCKCMGYVCQKEKQMYLHYLFP